MPRNAPSPDLWGAASSDTIRSASPGRAAADDEIE